jgi:hypothetical protein
MSVTNPHKFWPNIQAASFLLVLGLVLSMPFLMRSQVPFDTSLLTTKQSSATSDFHQIEQAYAIYPAYAFISDTVQSGDSLLWNPNAHSGTPFLAAWSTRCYSPFSAPFYFFSLPMALALSVLLKFWISGLTAFYTARKLGYPCFAERIVRRGVSV